MTVFVLNGSGRGDDSIFELTPIIVTAQKSEQNLQDVPVSVYVIDGSFIQESGIESISDAAFYVSNLHISELSARRTSFPRIRGLGSGQGDPVVTTSVDGVPQLHLAGKESRAYTGLVSHVEDGRCGYRPLVRVVIVPGDAVIPRP